LGSKGFPLNYTTKANYKYTKQGNQEVIFGRLVTSCICSKMVSQGNFGRQERNA